MTDKLKDVEAIIRSIDVLAERATFLKREMDNALFKVRVLEVENAKLRARLSHYETNEIERRLADGTG
jgi:regulator of replication initiation timing